jgi:glycosyltransferase involved in cell wall biosynthesis
MRRILIFSLQYYPLVGGAEVAIKEITDRISDEFEFHMVTLRYDSALPKVEKIGNVVVHRIGFTVRNPKIEDLRKIPLKLNKQYFQIASAQKAAKLHKQEKFDATWAMMAHASGIPAGIFKKQFPGVPYLLTLQEGDPPEYIERLMRPVWKLFKQGFERADYLQSISTFLQQWGLRMGFHGIAKIIPNGVNTAAFSHVYSEEEISAMREKLSKKEKSKSTTVQEEGTECVHSNEGDVFLVTTSRLVHKNAVDDVIRALPLLPENISFLIYGIGPDEAKLRALAKELGVEDRARFMGQISHAEMPLMLKACDIFIRPSRSEGMGNSFIEAMAAGLPVIATQEGGIADFLFDAKRNPEKLAANEVTGWAVDANAHEQIAAAVKEIVSSPEEVKRVTRNASEMTKRFDWDIVAGQMQELFKELVHY